MIQGGVNLQCIQEIKENCPHLRNVQHSHKKSIQHTIDSFSHKIPLVKSIHKVRQQQEQKIYLNIHKVKKVNLLQEIATVNPKLFRELRTIPLDQLQQKFAEFKRQQELNTEILSENYTQDSFRKQYDYIGSGVKIFNRPLIRNIMDDFDQEQSECSDSYINKYFDLN